MNGSCVNNTYVLNTHVECEYRVNIEWHRLTRAARIIMRPRKILCEFISRSLRRDKIYRDNVHYFSSTEDALPIIYLCLGFDVSFVRPLRHFVAFLSLFVQFA